MSEIIETEVVEAGAVAPKTEFFLGTVGSWSNDTGVEITLDGDSDHMTKRYKMMLMCRPLQRGARVVVMKQSGTYIVLGEISMPNGWKSIGDLPNNATTANIISKINDILGWMRTQGILWTSS